MGTSIICRTIHSPRFFVVTAYLIRVPYIQFDWSMLYVF